MIAKVDTVKERHFQDLKRAQRELRILVSTFYDMQKLRICTWNRLKIKKDGSMMKGYVQADVGKFIFETEIFNMKEYADSLMKNEKRLYDQIEEIVKKFSIYGKFLEGVKGCGPLMSAVIISYIDIEHAENDRDPSRRRMMAVSNLWSYAGLNGEMVRGFKFVDIGHYIDINGVDVASDGSPNQISEKTYEKAKLFQENGGKRTPKWLPKEGAQYVKCPISKEEATKAEAELGKKITGGWVRTNMLIRGDKRTAGFMIPYNKFLKTKLLGVLATGFKMSYGPYTYYFYNMRERLNQRNEVLIENGEEPLTKSHIAAMATRYMMKQFLRDLYVSWRTIENLPVRKSYEEEYLGKVHNALTLPELSELALPYILKAKEEKAAKKLEKEEA